MSRSDAPSKQKAPPSSGAPKEKGNELALTGLASRRKSARPKRIARPGQFEVQFGKWRLYATEKHELLDVPASTGAEHHRCSSARRRKSTHDETTGASEGRGHLFGECAADFQVPERRQGLNGSVGTAPAEHADCSTDAQSGRTAGIDQTPRRKSVITTMDELEMGEKEVRELDGQPHKPGDPRAIPRADTKDPLEILIRQEELEAEIGLLRMTGSLT